MPTCDAENKIALCARKWNGPGNDDPAKECHCSKILSQYALTNKIIMKTCLNSINGAWLLVRGLVKRPGKARPNRLSNSTLELHQTTYQKPYTIGITEFTLRSDLMSKATLRTPKPQRLQQLLLEVTPGKQKPQRQMPFSPSQGCSRSIMYLPTC